MIRRFVRMGANRTPDPVIGLGDRPHPVELIEPRADRQYGFHSGRPSAVDHGVALRSEIRKIEMAMAVDQHYRSAAGHPTGSSTKRGNTPSGFGRCVPGARGASARSANWRVGSGTASWSRSLWAAPGTKGCTKIAKCRIVSARV